MIEEQAVVTRVGLDGRPWIKSLQTSACGACLQKQSCGTATLAKVLPKREFAVDSELALQAGDRVVVAIDDSHLVLTSLLLYLLPLLLMFGGLGLAQWLIPATLIDVWLPEIALSTLLLGFWLIHRAQNLLLLQLCFRPQIIRKLAAEA